LAKAYLLEGRHDMALEFAVSGYQLITQSQPPTVFSMVVGYAGVAEVYTRLWEMQREDPHLVDISNSELRHRARRSCSALHSFSRVFRVGQPYKCLWTGLYDWQTGNRDKAITSWFKGLTTAEKLEMPYEMGLLHFEIARHIELGSSRHVHHIQEAEEIFSRLGASHNLARLHDLIDQG